MVSGFGLKEYKRVQTEKTRRRREIKKEIEILEKQRDELFGAWVFQKAMDEEFLRKEAVRVYAELKQLQTRYDAI